MNKIYLIAFLTILRKEMMRFFRIWSQTLLPPAITIVLYFIIFGHLIGSQLQSIEQFSYMQYLAPGLIMMAVITNAYANVVSSFFGMRFQKSIEELLIAPIPNALIILGFVAGGVVRGLLTGLLVAILALFFTHLSVHSFIITVSVIFFSALLFSLAGFTNALYARKFDDIAIVPTFILTPLTYLGGVFYSIQSLPSTWQHISLLNPILYLVNAFRFGLLGITDVSVYISFIILIGCCVLLFLFNLHLMHKGKGIRT
jgi:ABC-2 type transport system permease protein